jgi:hypothetical protein
MTEGNLNIAPIQIETLVSAVMDRSRETQHGAITGRTDRVAGARQSAEQPAPESFPASSWGFAPSRQRHGETQICSSDKWGRFPAFGHTLKKSSKIELCNNYILSYNPRSLFKSLDAAATSRPGCRRHLIPPGSVSISAVQCSCSWVESRDRACVSEPPTWWKRTDLYPLPTSGQP